MVGAVHAREGGHRHVTGDALASGAVGLVMGVSCRVLHPRLVAGHAGLVCLILGLEAVAAARRVALDAIDLPRLITGTHEPRCKGIVFTEVAAVRVEISIFQRREIEVVEEPFFRLVLHGQRAGLRVAARTEVVALLLGHRLGPDDLEVRAVAGLWAWPSRSCCALRTGRDRSHS